MCEWMMCLHQLRVCSVRVKLWKVIECQDRVHRTHHTKRKRNDQIGGRKLLNHNVNDAAPNQKRAHDLDRHDRKHAVEKMSSFHYAWRRRVEDRFLSTPITHAMKLWKKEKGVCSNKKNTKQGRISLVRFDTFLLMLVVVVVVVVGVPLRLSFFRNGDERDVAYRLGVTLVSVGWYRIGP